MANPVLLYLEELAAEVNMNSWRGTKDGIELTNPALYEFTNTVYMRLHWLNSPKCRKNHQHWRPAEAVSKPTHINPTKEEK